MDWFCSQFRWIDNTGSHLWILNVPWLQSCDWLHLISNIQSVYQLLIRSGMNLTSKSNWHDCPSNRVDLSECQSVKLSKCLSLWCPAKIRLSVAIWWSGICNVGCWRDIRNFRRCTGSDRLAGFSQFRDSWRYPRRSMPSWVWRFSHHSRQYNFTWLGFLEKERQIDVSPRPFWDDSPSI
jgi:hypothetical protein